jgi:hypothetical protein
MSKDAPPGPVAVVIILKKTTIGLEKHTYLIMPVPHSPSAISAKDGEPDAKKSDLRGRSAFADYREKEIGENRFSFIATSGYGVKGIRVKDSNIKSAGPTPNS